MKLLLVEDDGPLGGALHEVLKSQGYECIWVRTARAARRFLLAEPIDLLLLDIMLPAESGLDLLRWLRGESLTLPVMMITARDAVTDRVLGLDAGADDYLTKPFAIEECLSRIRSLLRRSGDQKTAIWEIGALRIDTARRLVTRAGAPIALAPREFELLLMLAARPGVVLTRAQLGRDSQARSLHDSNSVDVQIYGLRRKIGVGTIGTVRGVGYFLEREIS